MNLNKKEIILSIDNMIVLSDFVCYNNLGKSKKKIQKKLKKLKKEIETDEENLYMNEEWREKINE